MLAVHILIILDLNRTSNPARRNVVSIGKAVSNLPLRVTIRAFNVLLLPDQSIGAGPNNRKLEMEFGTPEHRNKVLQKLHSCDWNEHGPSILRLF